MSDGGGFRGKQLFDGIHRLPVADNSKNQEWQHTQAEEESQHSGPETHME